MPVETGMYNLPQHTPPNLLGMVGQFAQAQNALNQNALFQQEFAARKAMGPLFQQSVDPQTGEFNIDKFMVLGSQEPAVAFKLPEIMNQLVQRQLVQAQTLKETLANNKEKFGAFADAAGSLVTRALEDAGGDPNKAVVKKTDIAKQVALLIKANRLDPKTGIDYLLSVPDDGNEAFKSLRGFMDAANGVVKTADAIAGSIQTIETGGRVIPKAVSPRVGVARPIAGGAEAKEPTPAERSAMVEITLPNDVKMPDGTVLQKGTRVNVPRQSAGEMYTGTGAVAPGTGGRPPGALPSGDMQPTAVPTVKFRAGMGEIPVEKDTGRVPPGLPPGAVVKSLSPGQEKYMAGGAEKMVEYESNLNSEVRGITTISQQMQEAREMLKSYKAGGGGEVRAKMAQFAQAVGAPEKLVDKIASGNLAAAQEFQKLMVGQATQIMAQLLKGGGRFTNLEFQKFQEANPNLDTDPRAIEKIYQFTERLMKISVMEQQALSKYKSIPGADLTNFPAWWTNQLTKNGILKLPEAK